ncbi:MAG TPA: hypothetical protein VK211_24520 [Kamptonema sp.]|nr:hypothetical protein [Kamptonema sp.]
MLVADVEAKLKKIEANQVNLQKLVDTLNDHVDRIIVLENKILKIQNQNDSVPGAQTIL